MLRGCQVNSLRFDVARSEHCNCRPLIVRSIKGSGGQDSHQGLLDRPADEARQKRTPTSIEKEEESPRLDTRLISLPGGYRVSKRDLLKAVPALGLLGASYSLIKNWQAFSYVSPAALLKAIVPDDRFVEDSQMEGAERISAFRQYIADKENRGSMQAVPEFPTGSTWFNTSPLSISRELRGRVVILDFWTYCCVNCMHVLPGLATMEKRYKGKPLTVVGVHSAKFDNEKDDESIRNAVLRYDIKHPCVNDQTMKLWRSLGISSWPTMAIVSPHGKLIATLPGEGQEENVDAFIKAALEYYGDKQLLKDNGDLPLSLEKDKDPRLQASTLRYPGKVAVDLNGGRLFISDSNNHRRVWQCRVVITDLQGHFVDHIAGNGPQLRDGSFEDAGFNRPQGLTYSSKYNSLFVADTENHALRQIDFRNRQVLTLLGNGFRGSDYRGGKRGGQQQLNSPWDVTLDDQESLIFICLAGQHQIWTYYLTTGLAKSFSGSGDERNVNADSGLRSSWAQPSGASVLPGSKELVIADSESSSIRTLNLQTGGSRAIVGGDTQFSDNLFRFGDRDGNGNAALLQHPLAVCAVGPNTVAVADSYNHRIKILDTKTRQLDSIAGSGVVGFLDGQGAAAKLSEPSGLCLGPRNTIFISDTNNHVIRSLNLETRILQTLDLKGVPPPRQSPDEGQEADLTSLSGAEGAIIDPIQAGTGSLNLKIQLPPGYHLTTGANSRFSITATRPGAISFHPATATFLQDSPEALVNFRRSGQTAALLQAKIYYCKDGGSCLFKEVVFQLDFQKLLVGECSRDLTYEIAV